jgi:hypothetical protein
VAKAAGLDVPLAEVFPAVADFVHELLEVSPERHFNLSS